jgi:RHS repeat-associated protein
MWLPHDPSAAGEPTVTYNYDNLGRLASATDGSMVLGFDYDALGRNTSQTGPFGTTGYQYDAAGRRTQLSYPGTSLVIHYDYLYTGEMRHIRENGATSGVGVLATFGYDQLGRRSSLTRGNGTSTTYVYDSVSRLEQLIQTLPNDPGRNLTLGFSYDPAGQIRTNTRSNDLYSFTGHADASTAYTHNGLNQLTQVDGAQVQYDLGRNITLVPAAASSSGADTSYTYNSENMLVAGGAITLAYDPLMRLFQASSARWAYDGAEMIAEYNTSNAILRRFVHGPGVDEPIVWYEGGSTANRRFLHADERGSIIAISDSAGAVIGTNSYDEYGVPTSPTTGRFQYTGQAWISSLGLYYYRARFYNPRLGRFMQPDPIGYGGGMNMYAYAEGNPINRTDPTGLAYEEAIEVIGKRQKIDGGSRPPPMPFQPGAVSSSGGERMDCNVLGCQPEQALEVFGSPDDEGDDRGPAIYLASASQSGQACPAVPSPGAGRATINRNIRNALLDRRVNQLDPFGSAWASNRLNFATLVYPGGEQDYKSFIPGAADYGNFNYGAVGAAYGFSLSYLLDWSRNIQNVAAVANLRIPRGDNADDPPMITNGFRYFQQGCWR